MENVFTIYSLNEDMILALARQFIAGQLGVMGSNPVESPEFFRDCLNCPASARIISSFDFKHRTLYNISFIYILFQVNCRRLVAIMSSVCITLNVASFLVFTRNNSYV